MTRRFTGYGRGWSEERAGTVIGRLMQRLREPATTSTYIWVITVMWWAVIIGLLGIWAS